MIWTGRAYGWVKFAAIIAQLGLSVAVLVLVKFQLQGMGTITVQGVPTFTHACYVALPDEWPGACTYGEVVGSFSVLATFVTALLQLYITAKANGSSILRRNSSSKCPRRVMLVQSLLITLLLAWWASASCIFYIFGQRATAAGFPRADQRTILAACSWSSVALLGVVVVAELFLQSQSSSDSNSSSEPRATSVPVLQLLSPSVTQGYPAASFAVPPAAAVPYAVPGTAAAAAVQQYAVSAPQQLRPQQHSPMPHAVPAASAAAAQQYVLQGPQHPQVAYAVPAAAARGQQYSSQQQQLQQHMTPDGVVVGIPLIPIPALTQPQPPPPPVPPAARLAGVGPGGVQMAVLSGGSFPGSLRPPLPRHVTYPMQRQQPAAAAAHRTYSATSQTAAGTGIGQPVRVHSASGAGNVRVVNQNPNSRRSM